MLKLEEYIEQRKKEDQLNEFDLNNKVKNLRLCTNYVFEYFENYLDIDEVQKQSMIEKDKNTKYAKKLSWCSDDLLNWLIKMKKDNGKQADVSMARFLKNEMFYLLAYEDSDYRAISYECYSEITKRNKWLKGNSEQIYQFVVEYKEYFQESHFTESTMLNMTPKITKWIEATKKKYGVDLLAFSTDYIMNFYDRKDLWPVKHRLKSTSPYFDFDYNYKAKRNVFNIEYIYNRQGHRPFLKGHKKDLEFIMMYVWCHEIEDGEDYWQEYSLGLDSK